MENGRDDEVSAVDVVGGLLGHLRRYGGIKLDNICDRGVLSLCHEYFPLSI